jgi:hypothetical protein
MSKVFLNRIPENKSSDTRSKRIEISLHSLSIDAQL